MISGVLGAEPLNNISSGSWITVFFQIKTMNTEHWPPRRKPTKKKVGAKVLQDVSTGEEAHKKIVSNNLR